MVRVEQIVGKSGLRKFVTFPFSLYKDSPYWVPPLIRDEMETFDSTKNPVFEHADAWFFLAYKDGQIAGRVVAMINWIEVNEQKIRKMRFGWFDFIDDTEVSEALIARVEELGREHKMDFMEGPVGFSNLDKVGVLVEGFDHIGTMITWYNYPYYQSHYERLGFVKEKGYEENKFPRSNVDPALFQRVHQLIAKRYGLRAMNFKKTSEIMPWVDQMFDLFNDAYARLSSFVPITPVQKAYFKKKYIGFINPEYIKFVVDASDRIIAFAIVMPSFSEALQKARGKLFPFGWYHLLRSRKNSKDVIFYLIGILPEYQNKGVTSIIFNEYHETFEELKIETCYRTPELEENLPIKQIWKHFNPEVYKKRRTYKKVL